MKIERGNPETVTLSTTMDHKEWQDFYKALNARKKTGAQRCMVNKFTDTLRAAYPEIEPPEDKSE